MVCSYCRLILKLYIRGGLPLLIKISYHETIFIISFFNHSYSVCSPKTIKVSYEQKFIYNDSFFNQLPEDSREELKSFMTAPTYFELTNNGDLSLYKVSILKKKLLPQREKAPRIKI
jgi:hypothetical protein